MQPRRLLLVATSVVLALAAWVSRGALAVTDASSWPQRIGILPTRWAPAVLALVFFLALWRASRSTLAVLLIPGILLLPWLPVPVPAAALLWTGHVMEWVWVVTGLALLAVEWPRLSHGRVARLLARTGGLAAFALAFLLYLSGAWLASAVVPQGDEPHYLVITQSLLRDGDLKIENNHRRGDYLEYFPLALKPDFLRRGKDGEIYSIHAPGLPALVLPAFAAAGYRGVVVFLALLSAFGSWVVWRTGFRLTGSAGAAWFGWASVSVSAPFFTHAFMVFPDAAGATFVMLAVAAIIALDARQEGDGAVAAPWRPWCWLLIGGALGWMPWLHTRYAALAALLGAFLAIRLLGRKAFGELAALAALPAASATAWLGYFYAIYGQLNPAAPYADQTQSALGNIPRGLLGLIVDQQFGALPNAPVYAVAVLGLWSLHRLRPRLAVELSVLLVSYLLFVSSYFMWWGGSSAPARFAVPVLLMLGVPAAAWWSRQGRAGRAMSLAALAVSCLVTVSMVLGADGRLLFNTRDGVALWLEWMTPVVDLPQALPSLFRDSAGKALFQSTVWCGAVLVGGMALRRLARSIRSSGEGGSGALALATLLVAAGVVMAAGTANWGARHVAGPTPSSSALALLHRYDPAARPLGLRLAPFRRLAIGQVPASLPLTVSTRRPPGTDPELLVLIDVPAGVYRLSPTTVQAAQGSVEVTIGRGREPIARWTFDQSPVGRDLRFTLPVDANAVVISGDAAARRSMPRLAVEPVAVVPEVRRFTAPHSSRAARYGDLTLFAFEAQSVYVESNGTWIVGAMSSEISLAPAEGQPAVRFLLRNSPVDNQVTLRSAAGTETLTMKPGEVRVIELPVDPDNRGVLLGVTPAFGYRPADVDKSTQDRRYLGVWIEGAAGSGR